MQLPNIDSASFDIIYPLQTLKPIASLLRSRVQSDVIDDDTSWRERLEKSVLNVPLPISAILSEPSVSLSKLVKFKEGDIINLPPVDGVDFFVNDKLLLPNITIVKIIQKNSFFRKWKKSHSGRANSFFRK